MKKTMTFVAAILFASVSQAAIVTWNWDATFIDTDFNGVNGTVDFIFGEAAPDGSAVPFDTFTQTDGSGGYFNNVYTADNSALNG